MSNQSHFNDSVSDHSNVQKVNFVDHRVTEECSSSQIIELLTKKVGYSQSILVVSVEPSTLTSKLYSAGFTDVSEISLFVEGLARSRSIDQTCSGHWDLVILSSTPDDTDYIELAHATIRNLSKRSRRWMLVSICIEDSRGDKVERPRMMLIDSEWENALSDLIQVESSFTTDTGSARYFNFFGTTKKHDWQANQQVFERSFHQGKHGDWRYGERWDEAKSCLAQYHRLEFGKYSNKL